MKRQVWSFLFALAVVIGLVAAGCGGSDSTGANPGGGGPQFATIQVNHVLARTVPATVDTFRFTGRDSSGAVVFGPQDAAKATQVILTVPVTVVSLTIEYLTNGTVVGTYSQAVTLTAGTAIAITDPAWVDSTSSGGSTSSTSSSSTTSSTTSSSGGSTGLAHLNQLRALGGLAAVTENATLTDGCTKHAIYMVKNDVIGHTEDPALPFFTAEGNNAGQKSNVSGTSQLDAPLNGLIDGLMTSPFHGVGFIDSRLTQTGIGYFSEAGGGVQTAAAVDVLSSMGLQPVPPYPVLWPGNGQTVALRTYDGNEFPDPLTSLPGFTAPTGLPIYAMYDPNTAVNVTSFSVIEVGGSALVVGEIDGTNYTNPDANAQSLARQILTNRGAVVLMPQSPLVAGRSYQCSVTNNGATSNWTFTVDANAPRQEGSAPVIVR